MSFFCKDCGKEFYPKYECTCLGQPLIVGGTAVKDKMMICPKAKECSEQHCNHKAEHQEIICNEDGESFCNMICACPACIPYEPQPDTYPNFHCTLPDYRSCPRKESGTFDCFDENCGYWKDKTIPADLQPKHCTHSWVKRNEGTNLVPYLECIYCKIRKLPEQPTQMPLIDPCSENEEGGSYTEAEMVDAYLQGATAQRDADMAWHKEELFNRCMEAKKSGYDDGVKFTLAQQQAKLSEMPLREQFEMLIDAFCDWTLTTTQRNNLLNCLLEKVHAHDSAIAAQARREFAEKVIETMPLVRIPVKPDMDYPITETAMFTQALNEAFATEYKEILAHIRAMAEKE